MADQHVYAATERPQLPGTLLHASQHVYAATERPQLPATNPTAR